MVDKDKIKKIIFIFLDEFIKNKSLNNLKEFLSENIVYIGNKEESKYSGKINVMSILKLKIDNLNRGLKIYSSEPVLNEINEKMVIAYMEIVLEDKKVYELNITFTFIMEEEEWKIAIIHNSKIEKNKINDLKKLKEEIKITKSSMEVAINKSGVYYYEYNKDENTVDVNDSIMKLLNVESHIENYPNVIFENGLVVEEDINLYKSNIDDIKNERKDQVSFDVRFNMPDGGICWFRKYFISMKDSNGKVIKIIGVMLNINQLKNIEESISLEQNKKFDSEKSLKFYYKINVTKGLILEQKEKSEDEIIIEKCEMGYEKFLNKKLGNVIDRDAKAYISHRLSLKSLVTSYLENEEIEKEYRRKIGNDIFWVKLRVAFLLEPQSNDLLAFVYVYDISKEKASLLMLDALMMNQNEYILKKEFLSENCYIYASENNFMKFPKGLSNYDTEEYNKELLIYKDTLLKSKNFNYLNIDSNFNKIDKNKVYVKLCEFEDKKGIQTYKRVIYFLDSYYSLYILVLDVSDVIFNERKTKIELEEALKKAEETAISAENSRLEANKANAIKTDFLARMSHDMRTPMSAILGLTNFGLEECKNENIKKYFQEIKNSSEYLLQLINDILDMRTLESGNILLSPKLFKVKDFIKKVSTIIKSKIGNKGITLEIKIDQKIEDECLYLDEKRLGQILINILSNAIKYTKENKKVTWEILLNKSETIELINIIKDEGVGMTQEFLKHMYEPFSKEYNAMSKNEGGTGLGLAITKNLVDNMKGRIECDSTLTKGTTFRIVIPYKIKKDIGDCEKNKFDLREQAIKFKGKKVLLCEDVEINAIIIEKILVSRGFQVKHCLNGLLGLEELKKNKYDIILMDIRMPVMDGIEAAKEIRKINKDIPIVALSANAYIEDIDKSLKAGMNAHLSKPIDNKKLFSIIKNLIT